MSLVTPTTAELSTNIVAQLESSLSQTIPLFPKAFLRVIAKVLAAAVVILYKYAGFSLEQMFVATATMEWTTINGTRIRPLVELGREKGVGDPIDGVRAELVVQLTVTNQTGSLVAGSQLLRKETGVTYLTVADVPLDAATVDVTVRASDDEDDEGGIGDIGNLEAGDTINFASPPANVATNAVVQSTAVTGADAETEAVYRARILGREQARPQGGAFADYRVWAEVATGVAAVYPYKGSPGEVDVYIEATVAIDPDGIPDSTVLAAALAAIQLDVNGLASNRPANDLVNTLAITRTAFIVVVSGLVAESPATVQAAINTGVDEYLRSREPFIVGLSVLPRLDQITQAAVGGVVSEIVNAEGGTVASVTLKLGTTTITARTLGDGEKAKLNGAAAEYV